MSTSLPTKAVQVVTRQLRMATLAGPHCCLQVAKRPVTMCSHTMLPSVQIYFLFHCKQNELKCLGKPGLEQPWIHVSVLVHFCCCVTESVPFGSGVETLCLDAVV